MNKDLMVVLIESIKIKLCNFVPQTLQNFSLYELYYSFYDGSVGIN